MFHVIHRSNKKSVNLSTECYTATISANVDKMLHNNNKKISALDDRMFHVINKINQQSGTCWQNAPCDAQQKQKISALVGEMFCETHSNNQKSVHLSTKCSPRCTERINNQCTWRQNALRDIYWTRFKSHDTFIALCVLCAWPKSWWEISKTLVPA